MSKNRYLILLGFNTKQWWIYDEYRDGYIELPLNIKRQVFAFSKDIRFQEKYLMRLVAMNPKWIKDSGFFYRGIDI